ncbi:MAG: hypothetical protein GX362_02025 [Methanosarcinaceae archaeon]|nr:hypothetical protein [Methanosarcinaceae archaeon]
MKYAIIDIGSNTIRLSVYDLGEYLEGKGKRKEEENGEENKQQNGVFSDKFPISIIFQEKTMVGLASFVNKGKMTDAGIQSAISVLKSYNRILKKQDVDSVYVFATASIRNVTNRNSVLKTIQKSTGTKIEILSAEEEAKKCYIGATSSVNMTDGVLVDIGGGSTEVVIFEKGEILKAFSMPIGSLNLVPASPRRSYINRDELKRVRKIVINELEKAGGIKEGADKPILGVGGTLRAIGKIYTHEMSKNTKYSFAESVSYSEYIFNRDQIADIYSPIFSKSIPLNLISNFVESIVSKDKSLYLSILQIAPDRVRSLPYGLIILSTIMDETKSKKIILSPSGVREGYLLSKINGD